MLSQRYWFYLAFENSLCRDYVTEKFWRILRLDVVAVALGAADYHMRVPERTFVDVRDFRSPKDLAAWLRGVIGAGADGPYLEYLERKRRLRCAAPATTGTESFATKLCRFLHATEGVERRTDLAESWNVTAICVDWKIYYRGIAAALL